MSNQRPFFVTVTGVLAAIAAIAGFLTTLQMLGLFPLYLGEVGFFNMGWLGAILWAVLTLATIWALIRLWRMEPGGWLLTAIMSTQGIVLALVSIFGGSTITSMLPALILYGLMLVFLIFPNTREASSPRPATLE
ncbi:MAG: hypothetical protein R3C44_17950 [Chloroflexota bacterium]